MKLSYYISKLIKKSYIPAIKNSVIDKRSKVCSGSHVVNSTMGKYSYIGNYCTIISTDIGSYCSIADNCIIGGASHPMDWVSTSPVFHSGRNILGENFARFPFNTEKKTIIENDVWLGNNCLIKSGVKISNGAIVGMGSVVTRDIGPYEIWAGVPAKFIRKRFSDDIIESILKIKWWTWEEKDIKKNAHYFNDVEQFLIQINRRGINW